MKMLLIIITFLLILVLSFLAFLLIGLAKKKPHSTGRIALSSVCGLFLLLALLLSFATLKNLTDQKLAFLVGDWHCDEHLLEDSEAYTGYLRLSLSDSGSFSIYDGEAGNPAIKGRLIRIGKDKLLFVCTNIFSLDQPTGWEELGAISLIEFETDAEGALLLRYYDNGESATLKFYPE